MPWSYQLDLWSELRLALSLGVILLLPGWALLSLTTWWQPWAPLQRWIVAFGLSLSLYPVLYYNARVFAPWLRLDVWTLSAGLAVCGLTVVWRERHRWREHLAFTRLEWLALGVFAATLFTRFYVIRDWPYPASPDSLHHVLITQLAAQQGQLPATMAPYFPVPLAMYHLGLYALTATAQTLANVPAHAAVLWTAQVVNGLCGLGVYLVLDAKVGRVGAVVGAIAAGLLSFQPAILVSWGRFTPVPSQAVLPIAWWITWQALSRWRERPSTSWQHLVWITGAAALLNAAVFLFHFRVAGYYLPLIAITVLWELRSAYRAQQMRPLLMGVAALGVVSLLLVSPVFLEAAQAYVRYTDSLQSPERRQAADEIASVYYPYSWTLITEVGARLWLLGLALAGGALAAMRRNLIAVVALLWLIALWLIGTAYMLGIPLLRFTNMTAVLLALYLPLSLLIGAGVEESIRLAPARWRPRAAYALLILFLLMGTWAGRARAVELLPHLHFVREPDIPAMNWIRAHTPPDARFAVNTFYYSPEFLHGTDGGYWIPYFTGRQTTANTMLFVLSDADFRGQTVAMTQAVKRLAEGQAVLDELRRFGVTYIYVGVTGNYAGPALDRAQLSQMPGVEAVYRSEGVTIFAIKDSIAEQP